MYLFGGDYNPEQWSDQVRVEDLALMRAAGVNTATVGVFSWSWLEPSPGEHDFGWLDRVLDDLHGAGVGVALATPTASPPPWFTIAHPDALAQNRDGVRLVHGSRDTYCVNAPAYRSACTDIASRLAERYGAHPAVRLWHVHNEYGTWCFCDHCANAFRGWLRERYGDLAALNEAWTTAFWSQRYSDWEQVLPPRATQYLSNPAHQLDYRRFLSDSMLAAYREQRDVIKAVTPEAVVTTNFVLGGWVPVDHARWAGEMDLVAIDHYPSSLDGAVADSAFAADAARGWALAAGRRNGEWLLMEHAPSTVTEGELLRSKPPGMMARLVLGHIARGSGGALYFQWRASSGGSEQWHSALVPHAGPDSRVFREASALGATLADLPASDEPIEARVAVWYDEQCWWALQSAHLPAPIDYQAQVQQCHSALGRRGYAVDVVPPALFTDGGALPPYRLVVVPAAYLMSDLAADALSAYVAGGGHLFVTGVSGVADEHGRVRTGGYPGALRELLGVRVEEFAPLPAGESVKLSNGDAAVRWSARCHAIQATIDVAYVDAGETAPEQRIGAALTSRSVGTGLARYLSCDLEDEALERLLDAACAQADVRPEFPGLPAGVEALRSRGALWLFNHTDQSKTVEGRQLAAGSVEVIAG